MKIKEITTTAAIATFKKPLGKIKKRAEGNWNAGANADQGAASRHDYIDFALDPNDEDEENEEDILEKIALTKKMKEADLDNITRKTKVVYNNNPDEVTAIEYNYVKKIATITLKKAGKINIEF